MTRKLPPPPPCDTEGDDFPLWAILVFVIGFYGAVIGTILGLLWTLGSI